MGHYLLSKSDWGGAQRFDRLLGDIRRRADEFGRQHFVSDDIVQQFKDIGIYRAFVPKAFGGDERSPLDFLLAIEAIAEADGSAGWVASFGICESYLGGLSAEVLEGIWSNPDDIFAGAMFPIQPAHVVDGGYLLNGRWKWASGCMSAQRVGVGIKPDAADSLPSMAVIDAADARIDQASWDVHGMAGTGSFDLVVENVVAPREHTFVRGGKLTPDGPFFRYPTITMATQALAVTTLGVAKAAMRILLDSAPRRVSVTGAPNIGDRSYVQVEVAKAEARLQSARLYFYASIEAAWDVLLSGADLTPERISAMRLSSTHLTRECAAVTAAVYQLSGMEAAYCENHLSRCFRDAHMPTQHAFMGEITYQNAGAVLFGREPLPGYL